jgi:hypothetical protein
MGECAVYTVSIHGNGVVEYRGERWVGILGKQTAVTDQDTIKALLGSFERMHFFDLNDQHFAQGCTDGGQVVVSLSVDGNTSRIRSDMACVPRSGPQADLIRLTNEIDSVIGTSRWTTCMEACKFLSHREIDALGNTALLTAVKEKDAEKIDLLIAAGAEVNVANYEGVTPLMVAAAQNNPKIIELLLSHGADPHLKNNKGITALDLARTPETRQLIRKAVFG